MEIPVGLEGRAETVVAEANTALTAGSGTLPVFGTPYMIALMEQAARESLIPYLEEGKRSVGTHLDVRHLASTPIGLKVWAESRVVLVDRRRIEFEVRAFDETGPIGEGRHERFIIEEDKFMAKCRDKLQTR